jgi:hypothetical protein
MLALVGFVLGNSIGIKNGAIALIPLVILFIVYSLMSSHDGFKTFYILLWAPTILVACLLGLTSGYSLQIGNKLHSAALIAPVVLCWASFTLIEMQKVNDLPLVREFVKNSKDVSLALGNIKSVEEHPNTYLKQSQSLPDIYALTVYGTNEKKVIAVVEITRSLGKPTFKMACVVTHTDSFDIGRPCQLN